jgi:hypothetical protein
MKRMDAFIWLIAIIPIIFSLLSIKDTDLESITSILNYSGRLAGIAGLSFMPE